MFKVFIESAGGVKRCLICFETEEEAKSFCEENNWEWVDENEFVWDMDYREV